MLGAHTCACTQTTHLNAFGSRAPCVTIPCARQRPGIKCVGSLTPTNHEIERNTMTTIAGMQTRDTTLPRRSLPLRESQ